jgi:hypothetical protein
MERKCIRCNIKIIDNAVECPLCHGVLEVEHESETAAEQEEVTGTAALVKAAEEDTEGGSKSITYPDVTYELRTMQFITRLAIFASIVAEVTVLIINYKTFNGIYWSLIVGLGLIYGCITLLYSFKERKSLQRIIQVQMHLGLLAVILLDYLLGFKGWSFQYAIPLTLMGVDLTMAVFMIVGIDGWQNYIMTEIVTFALSILLIILHFAKVVPTSFFAIISVCVTGLILLGTIMLGQRMVTNELKRRFKV